MSQTVAALGGHVVPRWQDCCTHVVCALALGCPIVTPKFWDTYLSSVSSKTTRPDYLDFIPPLAEASLNNSNCVIADDSLLTLGEMIQPNVIVMSYPFDRNTQETQVTPSFKNIQSFLQLKGRRLIPESEIGLAILKCSLDAFCNPTFKSDTEQSTKSTQSLFTSNISGKTLLHSNESSSSKTSSLQTLKNTQSLSFNAVKSSDEALLLQESNILPPSLCKDESTPDSLGSDNSCPIRLGRRRTRAAVIVDETSSELTNTLSMEEDSNTLHDSDKLTTNTLPDVNRRKVEVSKSDIPVPDTRKREDQPKKSAGNPSSIVKRVNLININRCDDFEEDDDNMFNFVGEPRKTLANKSNSIKKREISSIADEEDEICPQKKKRFTEESMWQHSISVDRSTTLNDTISLEGFVSVMKIKAKDLANAPVVLSQTTKDGEIEIAPVRSSVVPIIIGGRDLEAGAGNLENGFHDGTVKQELEEEEDDENNFEFNQSSQNL
uniref:Nibrin second BRCT domain-containing protein n=1 Tax=Timema genevievae TaxID=629358 RepID=A0A7R9JUE2_TIMGE|nr:unnamed protein product [Timema genevievae]